MKIARQDAKARKPAPSVGAIAGATPRMIETAVMRSRASRPSKQSRTIARGRMPAAPAPNPWSRRATSSMAIVGADAQAKLEMAKIARPTRITGLRP